MEGLTLVLLAVVIIAVIATIVFVILVAFTTGFQKTGRMSGGLYCFTAPPGNGKSYVATHFSVMFMKQGRKVFTNYPIRYTNGREILITRVITKDMILTKNFNGSVIIIDEAHMWFWSRKFKDFSEEYKNWFSTLSQHEISLYYVVQHEDRVETIINDCANLFGVIEKVELPLLEMPLYFDITWYNRELDMQLSRTRPDVKPFHEERVWFDRDIAQSYNTKFFGTDKREPYEGVDWITWLKEEKNTEYKGYYEFSLKTRIVNKIYEKIIYPLSPYFSSMKKRVERIWQEIGDRFDRDKDREKEEIKELTFDDLLESEEKEDE